MRQQKLNHGNSGIQSYVYVRVRAERKPRWDPGNTARAGVAQMKICPGFGLWAYFKSPFYFTGLCSHFRHFPLLAHLPIWYFTQLFISIRSKLCEVLIASVQNSLCWNSVSETTHIGIYNSQVKSGVSKYSYQKESGSGRVFSLEIESMADYLTSLSH